jgi:hypothetical protein
MQSEHRTGREGRGCGQLRRGRPYDRRPGASQQHPEPARNDLPCRIGLFWIKALRKVVRNGVQGTWLLQVAEGTYPELVLTLTEVRLDRTDGMELGQMLTFIRQWIS